MEDNEVLVVPPMPADPIFVEAVDDAISGGAEHPETQPGRPVGADPRDFASLYIRHRSSFALHARRFLNDPRDVDEVLQEAFLRLFLAMPELETELQALSYCRRTVTNLCIDRWRADQRRPRLVDLETLQLDPSDESSYDDPVLRAEDAAIVREALSLLSPLHRAALVKREIEEKSLPQIAAELDIPEESVKHLLHRARRALRRLLVGTSVEPGVDLSNTQMLGIANKRLARATLRGANVLIVLFVAAVSVVGGLRVATRDANVRSGGLTTAVSPGVTGGAGNPAPGLPLRSSGSGHARHHDQAPAQHQAPAQPAPAAPQAPATHQPAVTHHPQSDGSHPTPPAPHHDGGTPSTGVVGPAPGTFTIDADVLGVVGRPAVRTDAIELLPTGSWASTTSFSAPVANGEFALHQVVQRSTEGVVSANLTPSVPTGADATTDPTQLYSSAVTTTPTDDGNVLVDVELQVVPPAVDQPTTAVATTPLSISVEALYTPDVTQVLAETVTVVEGSAPCCSVPPSTTLPNPPTNGPNSTPSDAPAASRFGRVSPLSPTARDDSRVPASS